jgi:predicted exporter
LRLSDIASPLLAARLQPLLLQRGHQWYGVVAPSDIPQPERFAATMQDVGATYVDVTAEANNVVAAYTAPAWRWLGFGALAVLAAVAVGLRDFRRVLSVVGAIGGSVLLTIGIFTVIGARLSLLHIVSLQFVVGVGLDYALFFARRQLDDEERARTLCTLVTCNAMTVSTFSMLALCQTPLLRDIGATVVIGSLSALVFAFMFAGERPRTTAEASECSRSF